MAVERPPNFQPPPVWQELMDSLGVTLQEQVDLLSIFNRMGNVEYNYSWTDESGTVHTIHTHRDEWERFASELSQEFAREITWKEIAYWILEERFPSFGNAGSFGQLLKEGIAAVQGGRTPTLVAQVLMVLYQRNGMESIA